MTSLPVSRFLKVLQPTMNTMATQEWLLTALAVWGEADATALRQLDNMFTWEEISGLAGHPEVEQEGCNWRINPSRAMHLLAELAHQAPLRYRSWHERALAFAADQIRLGNNVWEDRFIKVLDRFTTYLTQLDPQQMEKVMGAVHDVALTTPTAQQYRSYLEGLTHLRQDRPGVALTIFATLLQMPELDRHVRGRVLNSQAVCYETMGNWQAAMEGYHQSLALLRKLGDRLGEGKVLLNLGIMAYQLQRYSEAEQTLIEAMSCFLETNAAQLIASVNNELGLLCRDQGRWADAIHYFQLSANYQRQQNALDSLGLVLNNIGDILLLQGRLAEAEATLQEALSFIQTRIARIDSYLSLGLVYQANNDLPGAQVAYQTALDTALAIDRRDILAEIYYRLGEVARLLGDNHRALLHYQQAVQVIEQTREPIQDEGLKISLLGRWQQIYEALVLHCWQTGQPAAAWQWAERARARAFAEQIMSALTPIHADAATATTLGALPTSAVVDLAEFQAQVPNNAVVFNYFTTGVFDNHSPFLRALTPDNPLRAHLLTPAYTLLFVITAQDLNIHNCSIDPNAFLSTSRRTEDRSRYLTPNMLRQLWQRLLPGAVLGAAQRLYLILHGPLHHVPFAALVDADGQALVHECGPELLYAPSATILYQQWQTAPPATVLANAALAIGYDSTVAGMQLRHTEHEAQLIAVLTAGRAWVGNQPKRAALRAGALDYRWLHFACHGWFDYEKPLESYLLIGENEKLTAQEVLREWRINAELVTLSACQTGVHRLLRGDEPMGLIRGFLTAGARAVLATQWAVEDLPTFLLMGYFYQYLVESPAIHPARALGAAQLWLRSLSRTEIGVHLAELGMQSALAPIEFLTDDQPFAHPRFWASFVLFGG